MKFFLKTLLFAAIALNADFALAKPQAKPQVDQKVKQIDDLLEAVKLGNLDKVKAMIASGIDVNAKNKDGLTAVMVAAWAGKPELLKAMIAAGADVNAKDKFGNTALHFAAAIGDAKWVKDLSTGKHPSIKVKSTKKVTGEKKVSGIDFLLSEGAPDAPKEAQLEIVKALIAAGADVNAKNYTRGLTAVMVAVWAGKPELSKELIASGADVNAKNNHGDTALQIAARIGHVELVKALIAAKADVNAQSEENMGVTALMLATHVEIVKALIAAGADVNAKESHFGKTALMLFLKHPDGLEAVKALIEAGADVNAKDDVGWTALHVAHGTDLLKLLIAAGADVNAKTDSGRTPLMNAASGGAEESVKLLLEAGADVYAKNTEGKTALDLAYSDEVKALLEASGAK